MATAAHPRALGRTLTRLVYREAADRYGAGFALVVIPLVYLFREWPPWEIRDTIAALAPMSRAGLLSVAHLAYLLATAPLVRSLLASPRLRWWWSLPLSRGFWRAIHLRHLLLLNLPWLLAIAYGGTSVAEREGTVAAASSVVAFAGLDLAAQIAVVVTSDRGAGSRLAVALGLAIAVAVAVAIPGLAAGVLGLAALAAMLRRCGTPMPEPRTARRGRAGGDPVVALVRWRWLAARRAAPAVLLWGGLVQLGIVGLLTLGLHHVGHTEPEVARALVRGGAVLCAAVGASLLRVATRHSHFDEPHLTTWGTTAQQQRRASVALALAGALVAWPIGALVLPSAAAVGAAWLVELPIAALWAAFEVATATYRAQGRGELARPILLRTMLVTGLAMVLVGAASTVAILLPWLGVRAWRLPRAQRRAADRAARHERAGAPTAIG